MEARADVYQMVTDRILEEMAKGIIPWHKPWVCGDPEHSAISYSTRRPYSLLNQMLLGREGEWLTFNEVNKLGGKVKKGAKSEIVVFWKPMTFKEVVIKEDGTKEEVIKSLPFLKHYRVFHISDTIGIESKMGKVKENANEPIEVAEKIVNEYVTRDGLHFRTKAQDKAYYSPSEDMVVVPLMKQFDCTEEYYSTTFHELTHSTGHKSRLDRLEPSFFGTDPYAKEELVAEIGSAFLCQTANIDCAKAFKNSIAYLQSWSKRFKGDKKLIVSAASKATKATEYILHGNK